MSVKHKHYPHPVLESQFDTVDSDFIDSYFDVSINVQLEENGAKMLVETIFELENETLHTLIHNEEAVFALLFICESTSTRFIVYTNHLEDRFTIQTNNLNKTVIIRPYILANKDIKKYQNSSLIEPIKHIPFEVKRGDILAISTDTEVFIEKEKLFDVESIFEFHELKQKNAKLLAFNPDHAKIQIYLPTETYNKVKEFSNHKDSTSDVLISLFYVPAVVHALYSITSLAQDYDGDAKLLEYKDYNWYRTLERKLIDLKLGEDLSSISQDEVNNLAHRLMENPNYKALQAIEELIYGPEE